MWLWVYLNFKELSWIFYPNDSFNFDYKYNFGESVDEDWKDWKKVSGISFVNWKNLRNILSKNQDSVMLAWRYNVNLKIREYIIYENKDGKNYPREEILQILRTNGPVYFNIIPDKDVFKCYLHEGNRNTVNSINIIPRFKPTFYSYINLWYGGSNNSIGPWGGTAPQDMVCRLEFNKK